MSRTLAGLCLLAFSAAALAPPTPKDRPPAGPYLATRVGDKLTYEVNTSKNPAEVSDTVTEVEKKGDETIVTFARTVKGRDGATITKLSASPKGVFRHTFGPATIDPPECPLKLPANPGDDWAGGAPTLKGPGRRSVVRGEEEIEVPAGKFKALKIETESNLGGEARMTYWYARGVGLVKSAAKVGDTERGFVLKSFTPAK